MFFEIGHTFYHVFAQIDEYADLARRVAELESAQSAYVDNSWLFLISGLVVMLMAAGFCMLETGLVRSRNAAAQATKNVCLYAIAGVMAYLVGYHLIYPAENWLIDGWLAGFSPWSQPDIPSPDGTYAPASDWFFQMVFVATVASIVSGAVAERIRILPFLLFIAVLTAIIYPIAASWKWGGGWLDKLGFADFAGSTLVHSVGGWAALSGIMLLGPRLGKYVDGHVNPIPGSNIPLAGLGTFILWFGWFGFNGGSQLAAEGLKNINAIATIFVNTNMAASGGVIAALALTRLRYGKIDATLVFNGAIGGLVAITAEPLTPELWQALIIGACGGAIVFLTVPLMDRMRLDDVVGAVPAHLLCGIFGTLIVPWSNPEAHWPIQLLGVASIGVFAFSTSWLIWWLIRASISLRVSPEEERGGIDRHELGLDAYADFLKR